MTDERPGYVRVFVPHLRNLVAVDMLVPEVMTGPCTVEWWPVEKARAEGLLPSADWLAEADRLIERKKKRQRGPTRGQKR